MAKKVLYSYLIICGLWWLISVVWEGNSAQAYIDPGTTSVAFSALGYVVSMAFLGIAFFIRPVRSLLRSMFNKLTGKGKLVDGNGDGR
jgi:ABC-type sulfate transport system permease component